MTACNEKKFQNATNAMYEALRIVVMGNHSDDACSALWFACKEYRQTAPGYEYRKFEKKPMFSTADITTALRDSNWSELARIFKTWKR